LTGILTWWHKCTTPAERVLNALWRIEMLKSKFVEATASPARWQSSCASLPYNRSEHLLGGTTAALTSFTAAARASLAAEKPEGCSCKAGVSMPVLETLSPFMPILKLEEFTAATNKCKVPVQDVGLLVQLVLERKDRTGQFKRHCCLCLGRDTARSMIQCMN